MSEHPSAEAKNFKTIQYVGIPSRPVFEPTALDQVHALMQAVLRSEELARQNGGDQPTARKGHRVEIFDLPQVANLSVADKEGTLPPSEILKIFGLDDHEYLQARYTSIMPVAKYVMDLNRAIIRALNLDRHIEVTVASMAEDPEQLFHDSNFRTTILYIMGAMDQRVHALTEEQTVRDVLRRLVPNKYSRIMMHQRGTPKAEGYLSYGILEVAALIRPAIEGIHVLQYDVTREQGYLELARAVTMQVLKQEPEVAERIETMHGIKGLTLHSGTEADTYRMSQRDLQSGARLPVNPSLTVHELAQQLLNGAGRFDVAGSEVIKSHVLRLLDRGADILGIAEDERKRISTLYSQVKSGGVSVIEPEDAQFVLELLHKTVYEPIAVELQRENLMYSQEEITDPKIAIPAAAEDGDGEPENEVVRVGARSAPGGTKGERR